MSTEVAGIKDLPTRVRELGRIRMGEKATKTVEKDGKKRQVTYPVKRSTWRFTSQSPDLLAVMAERYGGEVERWEDAPGEGTFYQVGTEANAIDVLIPVDHHSLSCWYEFWTADGCTRRCDSETNIIDDSPCVCPKDIAARMEAASGPKPTACKPTTRLNVLLPDIPDLGFWRMECHGYQGAIEMRGALALYVGLAMQHAGAGAEGLIVRAELAIEQRRTKKPGKPPADYIVPVIRTPNATPAMLMAGGRPQLTGPRVDEIGAGDSSAAVPALGAGAGQGDVSQPPPAPPQHEPFNESDEKFVGVEKARRFVEACDQNGLDPGPLVELVTQGRTTEPAYVFIYEWDELRSIFADAQQKRAS